MANKTINAPSSRKFAPVYTKSNLKKMPDTGGDTYYITWTDPAISFKYTPKGGKSTTKDISNCIESYTVTWDYKVGGVWFDGQNNEITVEAGSNKSDTYDPPENATAVRVRVRCKSKTFTNSKDKEVKFFTGSWGNKGKWLKMGHNNATNDPETPSAPSYYLDYKTNNLLAYITHKDLNSTHIRFKLAEDKVFNDSAEDGEFQIQEVKLSNIGYAAYNGWTLEAGHVYRLAARAVRVSGDTREYSEDWSEWTDVFEPGPASLSDFTANVHTTTSILMEWDPVGVDTTEWKEVHSNVTYIIEYIAEDVDLYDKTLSDVTDWDFAVRSSSMGSTEVDQAYNYVDKINADGTQPDTTWARSYLWQGLDTGVRYFIRMYTKNEYGSCLTYTPIHEVILGTKPNAPTVWAESSTITDGSDPIFYWVHNAVDGSAERCSKIEYTIDGGSVTTIELSNNRDQYGEWKSEIRSHTINNPQNDGSIIKWRVCTRGVLEEYSDWSDWQEIKCYIEPSIDVTTSYDKGVDVSVKLSTSKTYTQSIKDISVEMFATDRHLVIMPTGQTKYVDAHEKIFTVTTSALTVHLDADDIPLGSNASYLVKVIANTSAGLTATYTTQYTSPTRTLVESDLGSSIVLHPETLTADISSDSTSDVYRYDVDGRYVLIGRGTNSHVDKHTPLRDACYRVVEYSADFTSVLFQDLGPVSFGEADWSKADWSTSQLKAPKDIVLGAFIQWGEDNWLSLLYNLDINPSYTISSTAVEYDGRTDPVVYYSSMQSQTDSWSFDVLKEDRDTLNKLRQLALYAGDVYIREPRGIGYWAHIEVSFTETHAELIVPVSLTITRSSGE